MSIRWSKIANNSNDILMASSEGFDSVEMSIDYLINLNDEEFLFQKNLMIEKNLFCETCNSILPKSVSVTEDGFNIYVWMDYLKKAARRASELGCKTFIWNNGRARLLPLEEDSGHAKEQVFQFVYMVCELLKHYDITLLIEPLGFTKTNYINSINETQQLLNLIDKDNFSSLVSMSGLSEIGFQDDDFKKFSTIIKHVYVEDPIASTNYDYPNIFKNFKSINYSCSYSLPNSANKESINYYKKLLSNL